MSILNFMKKSVDDVTLLESDSLSEDFPQVKRSGRKVFKKALFGILFIIMSVAICSVIKRSDSLKIADMEGAGEISAAMSPVAAISSRREVITVPTGIVKANPFVPYRKISDDVSGLINDVPKFDLISPPEIASENAEAARVMDTVVSGILYDKFSPSAILNIDGNDYLVKKGDTVNHYKVLAIERDSVTVKLGNNTYKAGIGELISEGDVNYNDVSNLNRKFGGEPR